MNIQAARFLGFVRPLGSPWLAEVAYVRDGATVKERWPLDGLLSMLWAVADAPTAAVIRQKMAEAPDAGQVQAELVQQARQDQKTAAVNATADAQAAKFQDVSFASDFTDRALGLAGLDEATRADIKRKVGWGAAGAVLLIGAAVALKMRRNRDDR